MIAKGMLQTSSLNQSSGPSGRPTVPDLLRWIVDLRGNYGGNIWPMIAGVGPVLGEGIIGWIVYNDSEYEREYQRRCGSKLR